MDNKTMDNKIKLLYGLVALIIIIITFITYDLVNTVENIALKQSENFKIVQLAKEETARQEIEVRKEIISKTETRDKFTVCLETVMTKSIEAKKPISAKEAKDICTKGK